MFELNNFDSIQIGVASPDKIRSWSHGEVKKPETINYRTQKPEKDGLFCEVIFGPTKDWECHCGKYKRIKYKGIICDKCGVEVTKSKVRRERMGHIELAAPVSHIWYFRGVPSRISIALDMSPKDVDSVIYLNKFVVLDPGVTKFTKKQVIDDNEMRSARAEFGADAFRVGMGAEAVKELLSEIDLDKESEELKQIVATSTGPKRVKTVKRLEVIEAFRISGNRPEWMILDVLPVLPPEIRPMVPLDGGRFATSDLNDLYRRVINRNNRLKKLIESGAPDIIVRNEKRMLQEAVDALIDNGRRGKAVTGPNNRELKSLSAMLKGKQGRFRQNLLGKRVDYSGRSVIVVGPELKMHQCGLPKEMALELFKPFVMKKLVDYGKTQNIKSAKKLIDRQDPKVWDILEEVIQDHPVLLNRAPTLHRLGIQAFEPVLVEGRAIKLHPLACGAFNADFDGDQMAVHVPLSLEAQAEARVLMLSTNNILKLADGRPIVSPSQDMVIGSYYLTIVNPKAEGTGRWFSSANEALMAYQLKEIELQAKIHVRMEKEIDGVMKSKIIETTVGRIIFNQAIPQDLGFVDRSDPEHMFDLEIEDRVGKKELSKIVDKCFQLKGATATSQVLDKIKAQGYKYSTLGAITTSVFDMNLPEDKGVIVKEAEAQSLKIEQQYQRGRLTDEERYNQTIKVWQNAKENVDKLLKDALGEFNPIWMMAHSGARGNMGQISQLCGMRGLVRDPSGKIVELPIKSSYREGLSVLEYFISSHGGRKGLADTALKTADSGYLTRRLVDVAQDVIVNEEDCGDTKGTLITPIMNGGTIIENLASRIDGRYTVEDVVDYATGEIIAPKDTMISPSVAKQIEDMVTARVNDKESRGEKVTNEDRGIKIRSALSCKTKHGICAKCYGKNMASGNPVKLGEAVGVIAAQSIGEPGTQLTMRTFHSGGVATADDITQGLPRVEELFEARKPKGEAVISEIAGRVSVNPDTRTVTVTPVQGDAKEYKIAFTQKLVVKDGDIIEAGQELTQGSINPQDMLRARGVRGVQEYLMNQVQIAYRTSGVETNDKHAEIIIRQMMRKVRIEDSGDTNMLPGELVDLFTFEEENDKVLTEGGRPARAKRTLLGITKASLATDSFLSAASFQETARVLTEAAIKNKIDNLRGLKENVILGKLIPAGTGMKIYKSIGVQSAEQSESVIVENRSHEEQLKLEEDIED
ncbi:MAG: DNA-directed RNA polymerase subunit beta' [Clostridia bacterium]|jgi:DNA-directed RNA polymerase subunit beta'|nr:DNA-directed RNA polymerase subunit beta' [Clostridia bacterium]